MSSFVLEAKVREKTGKESAKKYRKKGYIPAVVYGQGKNLNILIDNNVFKKIYSKLTKSTMLDLKLEDKKIGVLIKDYEKNYLKDEFIHIDFYEIDVTKAVHLQIPLVFVGTAIGIKEGGLLEKHLVNLTVECLPKDIVNHFEVNIEHLKINDSLHVKDLTIDSKRYKILSNPDEVIVRISGVKEEKVSEQQAETEQQIETAPSSSETKEKSETK